VLSEISFGVARAADRNPSLVDAHNWLLDLLNTGLLESLPLTTEAAEIAGELRAQQPTPPTDGRKRDASKPEQRVGWVLDLFVGATAWVHGCDIVTFNNHDFERIARLLPAADDDSRLLVASPTF
jgi:predicted nucleic acid-binding protein